MKSLEEYIFKKVRSKSLNNFLEEICHKFMMLSDYMKFVADDIMEMRMRDELTVRIEFFNGSYYDIKYIKNIDQFCVSERDDRFSNPNTLLSYQADSLVILNDK